MEGCPSELVSLMKFIGSILDIVKFGIPVILVILGMLDLGKAVIASEEKEIKAATKMLTKRAMYAVAIFFVIAIVQLLFGLFATDTAGDENIDTVDWASCLNYLK